MNDTTRAAILREFDDLPAAERDHATQRFEKFREDVKRIGYDGANYDSDPIVRAAELATVAVAIGGTWAEVFETIEEQMLGEFGDDYATKGAAESLALMWMGASQDVAT